ncbi:Mob1/phocein family protein [Coniochaeta sp. 2T2.1]|nr:Mob1/phocein family protein [Coniochaeta sp. 2T2.1]
MAMPSSPRLPSPPPPAEIQIGPKSPSMGPNAHQAQQIEQTQIDAAAKRRIHPGTRAADMAAGPPLIPLNELDSAFQLQEHLAALHYHHTRSNTLPITRDTAKLLATPPPGIDRTLWLYELCRFLIAQCNSLIVGFLFDTPPCSAATCPEMRASEWQFLCAVHDAPKSCCAIDYCCHTLDWAANVVTNPKIFPSRFVAPLSDGHDKGAALKNLVNVFRRLHRIFAHAWFQHRGVFWSVEAQTGLYVFFKTVCDLYDLLPAENYKLPPEAEGLEAPSAAGEDKKHGHPVVTAIARPPSAVERTGQQTSLDDDSFASAAARTNTRRHIRSNPSTGNAISMVPEVEEEDSHAAGLAGRMKAMSLTSAAGANAQPAVPPPVVEEQQAGSEVADVPVIVLDDGRPDPERRETQVEMKEVTSPDKEQETKVEEKQEEPEPAKEEEPSEPKPASVVVENELEKSVPEPAAEKADEPAAKPDPVKADQEEEDTEEVGDETVIAADDEHDETVLPETESDTQEAEEEAPPVSAIEDKDFDEAVAKDDPVAAAAVVAASEEKDDVPESKKGEDEDTRAEEADEPEGKKADEKGGQETTDEEKSKKED